MIVYLGLGASVGARERALVDAAAALTQGLAGFTLRATSRIYASAPAGGVAQAEFLNAAARLEGPGATPGDLPALLAGLHGLEARAGRKRRVRWEDRELDLDVLCAFDGEFELVREANPQLPHPRLQQRDFALRPLLDLDPALRSGGVELARVLESLAPGERTIQSVVHDFSI